MTCQRRIGEVDDPPWGIGVTLFFLVFLGLSSLFLQSCTHSRPVFLQFAYHPQPFPGKLSGNNTIILTRPLDKRTKFSGDNLGELTAGAGHRFNLKTKNQEKVEDIVGLALIKLIKSKGFKVVFKSGSENIDPNLNSKTVAILNTTIAKFKFDFKHVCWLPVCYIESDGWVDLELAFLDPVTGNKIWGKNITARPHYKKDVSPREDWLDEATQVLFLEVMNQVANEFPWAMLRKRAFH